jgi:hypothetical protein
MRPPSKGRGKGQRDHLHTGKYSDRLGFARRSEFWREHTAMSLTSHREALSIGAIHHFLKRQGVHKGLDQLTEIVVRRMKQGECNIRVKYVNGKAVILSDRAAEQTYIPKSLMR